MNSNSPNGEMDCNRSLGNIWWGGEGGALQSGDRHEEIQLRKNSGGIMNMWDRVGVWYCFVVEITTGPEVTTGPVVTTGP